MHISSLVLSNDPLWLESLPYPITIRQPAAPDASMPALLLVVFCDLGGLASGVLQHWLNLRPSQKARTQRLIPDPLHQPLDDPRCLTKGGTRLRTAMALTAYR